MINLDDILSKASRVGICGHIRPDGDAFGSCMGLYLFLKRYYPDVRARVYLEDNYSKTYEFVSGSDEIIHDYPEEEPADIFFALDCADKERLGRAGKYFDAAKLTVVIDHHISDTGFGMINEIQPQASSASELISLLIGKDRITKEIAEPLYMGIAHDTGIFQYSCTSSRTMMVGGWLMDTGIEFSKICDKTFFEKTYAQNRALGHALDESMLVLDGKVIFTVFSQKNMAEYHVAPCDLDGIVQQLRITTGVEASIFLCELEDGRYKVSMRSNGKVDVAKVAVYFGGGGHEMAAGCTLQMSAVDAVNNLVGRIAAQLEAPEDESSNE